MEFQDWTILRALVLGKGRDKLDYCYIGDTGIEFVGSLPWPKLRNLDISTCGLIQDITV